MKLSLYLKFSDTNIPFLLRLQINYLQNEKFKYFDMIIAFIHEYIYIFAFDNLRDNLSV
jgi:hypothetical protein